MSRTGTADSGRAEAVGKPGFSSKQIGMIVIGLVATIAAAQLQAPPVASRSSSLEVSATVVRPAEISEPVLTPEGAVIVIRNAERVTVSVDHGVVREEDVGTAIVELDGDAARTITLIY